MKIACFGGSFDPVHNGHLIAAVQVCHRLELDRLVFMVAGNPPHKDDHKLADARHRLEMVRLAVEGDGRFEVSDIEVKRSGTSFTIDTLGEFRRRLDPHDQLFFVIGSDTVGELHSWKDIGLLLTLVRFVTVSRCDRPFSATDRLRKVVGDTPVDQLLGGLVEIDPIGISSTEIRRMVADGIPIRYLVPDKVADYIKKHRLYG